MFSWYGRQQYHPISTLDTPSQRVDSCPQFWLYSEIQESAKSHLWCDMADSFWVRLDEPFSFLSTLRPAVLFFRTLFNVVYFQQLFNLCILKLCISAYAPSHFMSNNWGVLCSKENSNGQFLVHFCNFFLWYTRFFLDFVVISISEFQWLNGIQKMHIYAWNK